MKEKQTVGNNVGVGWLLADLTNENGTLRSMVLKLEEVVKFKDKTITSLTAVITAKDAIIHRQEELLNEYREMGEDHEPRGNQETGAGSGGDVSEL